MEQLQTDLATLQTAVTAVVNDVAALPTGTTDPNDGVVAQMVSALESVGYTVTAPTTEESELPSGDTEN